VKRLKLPRESGKKKATRTREKIGEMQNLSKLGSIRMKKPEALPGLFSIFSRD